MHDVSASWNRGDLVFETQSIPKAWVNQDGSIRIPRLAEIEMAVLINAYDSPQIIPKIGTPSLPQVRAQDQLLLFVHESITIPLAVAPLLGPSGQSLELQFSIDLRVVEPWRLSSLLQNGERGLSAAQIGERLSIKNSIVIAVQRIIDETVDEQSIRERLRTSLKEPFQRRGFSIVGNVRNLHVHQVTDESRGKVIRWPLAPCPSRRYGFLCLGLACGSCQ